MVYKKFAPSLFNRLELRVLTDAWEHVFQEPQYIRDRGAPKVFDRDANDFDVLSQIERFEITNK